MCSRWSGHNWGAAAEADAIGEQLTSTAQCWTAQVGEQGGSTSSREREASEASCTKNSLLWWGFYYCNNKWQPPSWSPGSANERETQNLERTVRCILSINGWSLPVNIFCTSASNYYGYWQYWSLPLIFFAVILINRTKLTVIDCSEQQPSGC